MSSPGVLIPSISLAQRELVRFLRQRNRIIGSLFTPIMFWLPIGLGMGNSFSTSGAGGHDYLQYMFPGTVLMVMLFTAIFSTISIIEDRREGFLQSVLVAPVPREAIVLGKILGGTVLAAGQGAIFLLLAPLAGIHFTLVGILLSLLLMVLISFALTGLGVCIAWRMQSTQGFHAIMNLFLLPMWLLSGALFPAEQARGFVRWIMNVNPLRYSLSALRLSMFRQLPDVNFGLPGWGGLGITLVFAAVMFAIASAMVAKPIDADLQ